MHTHYENRRSFLKQFIGATTTISWIVSGGKITAGPSNFYSSLKQYKLYGKTTAEKFWRLIQQQFPLTEALIYMNNGGLGPSPYPVIETIHSQILKWESISETGHVLVDKVREKMAKFFNCGTDEIAFTSNTTEGMNIIARGLSLKEGDEVLMTTHEHPGGSMPWIALSQDEGILVKLFEPEVTKEGNLRIIQSSITSNTKVLSISHVLCTTGLIFPVKDIAELCRQKGIILVLDGAQVPGMIPVDFRELGCDFYATSGHKWLCGPKGIGLIYVRQEMLDRWRPTYVGAYSDKVYQLGQQILEFQRAAKVVEYGTRNIPLIMGIGAAIDFFDAIGMKQVAERGRALAAYLKEKLMIINKVQLLTPTDPEVSGSIVTFRILDQNKSHTDFIKQIKDEYNIRLRPVGENGLNAIRVSLHVYNNFAQVDRLVEAIKIVTA